MLRFRFFQNLFLLALAFTSTLRGVGGEADQFLERELLGTDPFEEFQGDGEQLKGLWGHSGTSPIRIKTHVEVDPTVTPTYRFVADADFQIGSDSQLVRKEGHIEQMISMDPQPDFLITPGDLTHHARTCSYWFLYQDELGDFIKTIVDPLEAAGMDVFVCAGNHDEKSGMIDWIKKREGGERYTFLYAGLRFICCGLYPDKDTVEWLQTISTDRPVVAFWHYNVSGPFSADPGALGGQWWSEEERDAVFDVLLSRFDTRAVIVGHWHHSKLYEYRGIPVAVVGGRKFCVVDIDSSNNLSFSFQQ
ncbi:MAG: metallophosphoesterase family protein [Waddliaceae bacterium]